MPIGPRVADADPGHRGRRGSPPSAVSASVGGRPRGDVIGVEAVVRLVEARITPAHRIGDVDLIHREAAPVRLVEGLPRAGSLDEGAGHPQARQMRAVDPARYAR